MSGILPIPSELLTDSAVLKTPSGAGYKTTHLEYVRIIRTSEVTDYTAGRVRDCTEIVMYYDCVNSYPEDVVFSAGQLLEYCGEEYELVKSELFAGEEPHHYRITARKTGGAFSPN